MIGVMDKYEKRRLRLIRLRDEKCGGNAAKLARTIGREPSYVSRMLYEEGKKEKRRIADDMVEVIENAFSLPRGWMDGIQGQDPQFVNNHKENVTNVVLAHITKTPHDGALLKAFPLLDWTDVSLWYEDMSSEVLDRVKIFPTTTKAASTRAFWLEVKDDSMTSPAGRTFPKGMYIFIDPERVSDVKSGRFVLAKQKGANEVIFKQYVVDGALKILQPLHPGWQLQSMDNYEIIGLVLEAKWPDLDTI